MRSTALVLLAMLLAGAAAADHVYSHRVYVVGRVVDADGLPAPGLALELTFEGLVATGRCYDSKDEVTGPQGDFEVCRHAHSFDEGASVRVRAGGSERETPVDPDLRHAAVNLRLDGPRPARDVEGDILFGRTVLVAGRSFTLLRASENAEGVHVNATPLGGNVSVELRAGETSLGRANATVDEHGRYRAELPLERIPPGAVARARLGPDASEAVIDPVWRRADVNVVRDLRLAGGPGDDAPGSQTPLGGLALVALVAAGLIAAGRARRRAR